MALLDPNNGRAYDLAPSLQPRRTWVLASSPRTASTLLGQALREVGTVGQPTEWLNPMQLRDWQVRDGSLSARLRHAPLRGPALLLVGRTWGLADAQAHLARVQQSRTSATGLFAIKLHFHHMERWAGPAGRDAERLLPGASYVWLSRRDRLAQAISWARAAQSGRWASTQRAYATPRYSARLITSRLRAIQRAETGWAAFFAARQPPLLRLYAEDVQADLDASVQRVLSALGQPPASAPAQPTLRRQADALSAQWAARFRAEQPELCARLA